MTPPLLSACLIVKNEEAVLEACLASIRAVVDEVVVVDTGSSDRSVEIAERFGARVFHRPWDDDFATPRNLSLDHASGQWILYIDADERLEGADRDGVERLLGQAEEVAFRILLRPHRAMTPYFEYRLWRNDPRIRFEGIIHERVVPAIHAVSEADGRPISNCAHLLLEHVGYEGDQRHKHIRNLPLLERFVAEHPEHLFARHHLATVLDGLERPEEAEAVLESTVDYIRAHEGWEPYGVLAYAALVECRQRRGAEFRPLLEEARRRYSDNCVLLWMEGQELVARRAHREALLRFDAIVEIAAEGPQEGRPAYSQALLGEAVQAARGSCLFKLGRYREAAEAYRAAAALAPDDPSHVVKQQLALSRVQYER